MIRRRRVWAIAGLLAAAALAWDFQRYWHAATAPPPAAPDRVDAIVVLTGGGVRVTAGLKLLAAGKAERLYVSGAADGVRVADIAGRVPGFAADLLPRIELGRARDTAGNAAETAAWAEANEIGAIRLVTAYYHMPRSLLLFRQAAPGVTVWPEPVTPPAPGDDPGAAATMIAGEWLKYLATRLGFDR